MQGNSFPLGFENIDQHQHGELLSYLQESFNLKEIDGHQVIQTPDGLFVGQVLMDEDYFIQNWLTQFAIGHAGEKNYFDFSSWDRLTDNYSKGVILINKNREVTLIIRKFMDFTLPTEVQSKLDICTRYASKAKFANDSAQKAALTQQLSEQVTFISDYVGELEQDEETDMLTNMIPAEYYARHGVIPSVMKHVIYLRDNYTWEGQPLDPDSDIIKNAERVFTDHLTGKPVSQKDKDFILALTKGEFNFDPTGNEVEQVSSPIAQPLEEKPFNPLED